MYRNRVELYKKIEKIRNSKVLAYITGDRPGLETQIHPEVVDMFAEMLDKIFKKSDKISLLLYSRGGVTLAGWNIVNLIRMFCDEFEVIIPSKALSTATLISIGADRIVMTKQATLGPIDPSVNGPYNPREGQSGLSLPVSVEDVAGFFSLARKEVGGQADLAMFFQQLATQVHPLALGNVSRARDQIKMLASKLLERHMKDGEKRERVISFLCSESGSHDYTINRREAADLGLPVENPSEDLYNVLNEIYVDFREELNLRHPFNPMILLGGTPGPASYRETKALIESADGGSYQMRSSGSIISMAQNMQQFPGQPIMAPVPAIFDQRTEEGWFYEPVQQ